MPEKEKGWLPNFRQIPIDETIRQAFGQLLFFIFGTGGLLSLLASIFGQVPRLTSVGWLTVFLGSSLGVALIWAVYEWASLARKRKNISVPPVISGSDQTASSKSPAVLMQLVGNPEHNGVRFTNISTSLGLPVTQAEDIILRVTAQRNLKNVSMRIRLFQLNKMRAEISTFESFSGDIPNGKEQEIIIYRELFDRVNATYMSPKGGSEPLWARRTIKKTFFPEGNPIECNKDSHEMFSVKITVLHEDGPNEAGFMISSVAIRPHTIVSQLENLDVLGASSGIPTFGRFS
jgi:hypothetical protein